MPTQPLPVLACGAWLKNTACLLQGGEARWSALHGDLQDPAACEALESSLRRLANDADAPVAALAHDLHPDFFSTRMAQQLAAEWGIPAMGVQHHHAHVAAVVAEHAPVLPVIGLALDGVGLGTDGNAWGGELIWMDAQSWKRLGHLWPLALPGGDLAAREPWRMAASALHALGAGEQIVPRFESQVGQVRARGVQRMLTQDLNCPRSSSAGRWFDAAAGALYLNLRQSHEAEAAMALEQAAADALATQEPEALSVCNSIMPSPTLDLRPLLAGLFDWPDAAGGASQAAAWFHVSLARSLTDWAGAFARQSGCRTVCLSGGCFFNAVLKTRVIQGLEQQGLQVLWPQAVGCGDAALALGQAWVVAHSLQTLPTAANPS